MDRSVRLIYQPAIDPPQTRPTDPMEAPQVRNSVRSASICSSMPDKQSLSEQKDRWLFACKRDQRQRRRSRLTAKGGDDTSLFEPARQHQITDLIRKALTHIELAAPIFT